MRLRLTALMFVVCMSASCSRSPDTLVFDFTSGFTLANAHWPTGEVGRLYERYGNYHFIIKLGDGLSLDMPNGNAYSVLRDGDALGHIIVYFGVHSTLDQAYSQTKKIMEDLREAKDEFDDLERWHTAVKAHPPKPNRSEFGYHGRAHIAIVYDQDSADGSGNCSMFVEICR